MTCGASLGQKLGIKDSMQEEKRRRRAMHDVFLFIAGMLMPVVLSVVIDVCELIKSKIRRSRDA